MSLLVLNLGCYAIGLVMGAGLSLLRRSDGRRRARRLRPRPPVQGYWPRGLRARLRAEEARQQPREGRN